MASESPAYRVLARKYRPQSFDQLIGQDAMVTTLANAIARGRLAHAFLLTGVRGVGKTSTARLLAKSLNCVGADGTGGPTISPCGGCEPCRAIAEGRHIDVVEMDAASNRGIDDVREIIEAVRYAAVSARFKVYIVDEVHMLTKEAFNALLKTLEEPPGHVKFVFATTEVKKVPITVLSRCQRFDLRRIPADTLAAHFGSIAKAEEIEVEPEALALVARAAEGSVRDGLSILDQAIAHGEGAVTGEQVRAMLGLFDRSAVRDLLGRVLAGDAAGTLAAVRAQYDLGTDPSALLVGLLEAVHGITRAKVSGADDPAQSAEEREAYADWASRLGHGTLHRLWQLLLKGHAEVGAAALPIEAAEMALLRTVHAAELPDPSALLRQLGSGAPVAAPAREVPARAPEPVMPPSFAALVAALEKAGKHALALELHDQVGLVRYAPPELVIRPAKPMDSARLRDLAGALKDVTGAVWTVALGDDAAQPTLLQQERAAEDRLRDEVLRTPVVAAAMNAFPGAELVGYEYRSQRS